MLMLDTPVPQASSLLGRKEQCSYKGRAHTSVGACFGLGSKHTLSECGTGRIMRGTRPWHELQIYSEVSGHLRRILTVLLGGLGKGLIH